MTSAYSNYRMDSIHLSEISYAAFDTSGNALEASDSSAYIWMACCAFEFQNTNTLLLLQGNADQQPSKIIHQRLQKQAVRQLLNHLITQNTLDTLSNTRLILDESSYPYRLCPIGYYVSFTHSRNWVACALCRDRPIGIDLELNPVAYNTAVRFYTLCEIEWLNGLDNDQQQQGINLLWMLKEAAIKKNSNQKLFKGLKASFDKPAKALLHRSEQQRIKINKLPVTNRIATVHYGNADEKLYTQCLYSSINDVKTDNSGLEISIASVIVV